MTAQQQRGRRRWYQFTLRSVLLVFLVIVLGLVAWRAYVEPYRHERQAMKLIEDLGGRYSTEARGPAWLAKLFGTDHFQVVTFADLADCDEPQRYLPTITRCPWLEVLVIGGDAVGDEQTTTLRRLVSLKGLVLDSTSVTEKGVGELQEALPELMIHKSQRRAIAAISRRAGIEKPRPIVATRAVSRAPVFSAQVGDEHFEVATDVFILEDNSDPQFTDAEMAPLRVLVDLETFGASGYRIQVTDAGLRNLAHARSLFRLELDGAAKVTDLSGLHGSKITILSLVRTPLTDGGLRDLPLRQISCLALRGTKVTNAGLRAIRECTALTHLDLAGMAISDQGLAEVSSFETLESLALQGTTVADDGLAHVVKLRALRELNLEDTRITGTGLARLKGLGELRILKLGATKIDAADLAHLTSLPQLEELDLGAFHFASPLDDSVLPNLEKLAGLRSLGLVGTKITDQGLSHFRECFLRLERLNLYGTSVSPKAVEELRAARPKLRAEYSDSAH